MPPVTRAVFDGPEGRLMNKLIRLAGVHSTSPQDAGGPT